MKMYKTRKPNKTSLRVNNSVEGETIEVKVQRIVIQGDPITDGAPMIYTERKDGVRPEYDIRTDRFELAIEAMDRQSKDHLAKREERHTPKDESKDGDHKTDSKQE